MSFWWAFMNNSTHAILWCSKSQKHLKMGYNNLVWCLLICGSNWTCWKTVLKHSELPKPSLWSCNRTDPRDKLHKAYSCAGQPAHNLLQALAFSHVYSSSPFCPISALQWACTLNVTAPDPKASRSQQASHLHTTATLIAVTQGRQKHSEKKLVAIRAKSDSNDMKTVVHISVPGMGYLYVQAD